MLYKILASTHSTVLKKESTEMQVCPTYDRNAYTQSN